MIVAPDEQAAMQDTCDTMSEVSTMQPSTIAASATASSSAVASTTPSYRYSEPTHLSCCQSPEAPPLPRWWSPGSPETMTELSHGSRLHNAGQCIPCRFFRSKRGCKDGARCNLCHEPHPELTGSAVRRMVRRSGLQKRAAEDARAEGHSADQGELRHWKSVVVMHL